MLHNRYTQHAHKILRRWKHMFQWLHTAHECKENDVEGKKEEEGENRAWHTSAETSKIVDRSINTVCCNMFLVLDCPFFFLKEKNQIKKIQLTVSLLTEIYVRSNYRNEYKKTMQQPTSRRENMSALGYTSSFHHSIQMCVCLFIFQNAKLNRTHTRAHTLPRWNKHY